MDAGVQLAVADAFRLARRVVGLEHDDPLAGLREQVAGGQALAQAEQVGSDVLVLAGVPRSLKRLVVMAVAVVRQRRQPRDLAEPRPLAALRQVPQNVPLKEGEEILHH